MSGRPVYRNVRGYCRSKSVHQTPVIFLTGGQLPEVLPVGFPFLDSKNMMDEYPKKSTHYKLPVQAGMHIF
jgi:hypothetical protein